MRTLNYSEGAQVGGGMVGAIAGMVSGAFFNGSFVKTVAISALFYAVTAPLVVVPATGLVTFAAIESTVTAQASNALFAAAYGAIQASAGYYIGNTVKEVVLMHDVKKS